MSEADEDDERRFSAVLAGLEAITFPPLDRPAVPFDHPTWELIQWAMRFYASVLLSHVRQLLRTFLSAVRSGEKPGAFVVGRAIFELGAHAILVFRKFEKCRDAKDWIAARDLFSRATMGNREMKDQGEKTTDGAEWVAPFHVNDAIRALDEFLARGGREKGAEMMYGTLSEHSHPNQGAFSQYYRFEESEHRIRVVFLALREDYSAPPLPEVGVGVATSLSFGASLLEEAGDSQTAALVSRLLDHLYDRES